MKISSVLAIVLVMVMVVSLAAIWFYPSLQDFMAGNSMWNGIKDFSKDSGVRQIDSLNNMSGITEKDVLIEIPYLEYSQDDLIQLQKFVLAGGTLIVMDDFGYGNSLLEYLGLSVRFANYPLLDPLFCYKNPYLPRITDFSSEINENNISNICLNHATILNAVPKSNSLATSSVMSYLDINNNGTHDTGEPAGPFAVAAKYQIGRGTLELAADPSLIINTMVQQNDNYRFVQLLVSVSGEPGSIFLDRSHLTKSPLDTYKIKLSAARTIVSGTYVLLTIIALVFAIAAKYAYRRELFVD